MRKVIAILVLIGLGYLLFIYTGNKMEENAQNKVLSDFEVIMSYDFDKNYPQTIDGVLKVYRDIMEYTYSQKDNKAEFFEIELPNIIRQQRELYDTELVKYNEYDVQLQKVINEFNTYDESNFYIIDSKMLSPEHLEFKDEDDRELSKVKVVYYTNTPVNIYMEYGLRKIDDKWKIVGYTKVDEFIVTED